MVDFFACDMAALSQSERTRHFSMIEELPRHLRTQAHLSDGYALDFPPDSSVLARLASCGYARVAWAAPV